MIWLLKVILHLFTKPTSESLIPYLHPLKWKQLKDVLPEALTFQQSHFWAKSDCLAPKGLKTPPECSGTETPGELVFQQFLLLRPLTFLLLITRSCCCKQIHKLCQLWRLQACYYFKKVEQESCEISTEAFCILTWPLYQMFQLSSLTCLPDLLF